MTGKAKAALEEQTIRTSLKKWKTNGSGDGGNTNLKKAKKTWLPGNTSTNGGGCRTLVGLDPKDFGLSSYTVPLSRVLSLISETNNNTSEGLDESCSNIWMTSGYRKRE
ncbi:hypothetical protein C8R48DRAFT_674719 [Suillus tomentosus]|nr:hypothetical protein C8R48DRAFT_674719 [Suillus tomentosus]